jgi:general secretion pathway protein H
MRYLSKKGFTLLELLLVLLIAGLAVSLVVVSTVSTQEKTVLHQEARRLQRTLEYARELSLMKRRPFVFVPADEGGSFWLESDGEPFGKELVLPKGLLVEGDVIVFLPKGNNTGGSVAITNRSGKGYFIELDPATGKAELQRLQPA